MTRAVFAVGPFLQQEFLYLAGATEDKLRIAGGLQDALLHHAQFDFQDLLKMVALEGLKHYRLVDAVHELRREFAPRRFRRSASNLIVELCIYLRGLLAEAETAGDHLAHFTRAKIRRHHDHTLRQIDAAIVAERERGFVQNA